MLWCEGLDGTRPPALAEPGAGCRGDGVAHLQLLVVPLPLKPFNKSPLE